MTTTGIILLAALCFAIGLVLGGEDQEFGQPFGVILFFAVLLVVVTRFFVLL